MKAFLVPAILLCGSLGAVESPTLRSNVGVGLGTLLFEAMGYTDNVLGQTLAATTNGSFSNQLFFVTTGTGGAKKVDFVQNKPLRDYVNDNMDAIARDMATGSGESLDTLAELAGVAQSEREAFKAKLQANFGRIFTSADVTADEVVTNLAAVAA